MMYFPAGILTGRIDFATAVHGFSFQASWVVVLIIVAQFLWRFGLRKHTAVGG